MLDALNEFEGAVVLISHDRRLIEATADRLFLVANGGVEPFDGDLEDYRRFLLTKDREPTATRAAAAPVKPDATRRDSAERRRQLKPLKEKVEAAEAQLAALNIEIAKLDKALSDPLLFTKDPAKGAAVSKKRAEAQKKLDAAEARWISVSEAYEQAAAE